MTQNITNGIYCRDPYILPFNGKYYLYRRIETPENDRNGVEVLVSKDLILWDDPKTVINFKEEGYKNHFWAPECHFYKGSFYIFSSLFVNADGHRRIAVYKSNTPIGEFKFIDFISSKDYDAIDGTLYIDNIGNPWLIFVHEWTSMPDQIGGMSAIRLSNDLDSTIGDVKMLFYAKDPSWATAGVTDGPFMIRYNSDILYMLWSNFSKDGYVVTYAQSSNGEIDGEWIQKDFVYCKGLKPEYVYDGGHACHFKTFDGRDMIAFHSPNFKEENVFETLTIKEVKIDETGIKII